jgi:hypothetical protein
MGNHDSYSDFLTSRVSDLIGRFGTILLGPITRSTIDYCSFLNRSWKMS